MSNHTNSPHAARKITLQSQRSQRRAAIARHHREARKTSSRPAVTFPRWS